MRYDNEMKITMRTTKMAEKAMEILKNRLIVGFDCDKDYDENPAMRFAEDLEIDGRIVKLPFDHAYYLPKDALTVMCELMEYLAKNFTKSSFSFENCNLADEDMSRVDATFKKGVLEIQTIYYPKRLTYANMEKHIKAYDNAAELLDVFETVKALSQTVASPYKFVSDWFVEQFPSYDKAPTFKDGKLTVLPVKTPDIKEYKIKKTA